MTNSELSKLSNGLPICENIRDKKIAYAIAKNTAKVQSEMKRYMKDLRILQLQHAQMKDGKTVVVNDRIQMKDDDRWNEAYEKFADTETELKLHRIRYSDIPENVNGAEMAILLIFTDGKPN
jgi:hypothetical protein